MTESTQLYNELHNVVRRYQKEGTDALTLYVIIGALEAVKADCLDALEKDGRKKAEGA